MIVWPAAVTTLVSAVLLVTADLTSARLGAWTAGTVAVELFEVTAPVGPVPVALATLTIDPASMSAWVTV